VAGAITVITDLGRPGAPATVAPPAAPSDLAPEPVRRYFLVASQDQAEQFRIWLRDDSPAAADYAEIFIAPTATEGAAVYDVARLALLYDGDEIPVVDLRVR
jgi:hypothetical protein